LIQKILKEIFERLGSSDSEIRIDLPNGKKRYADAG